MAEPLRRVLQITNRRGLHARASAKFVAIASEHDALIEVSRGGTTVNGDSIMGLMMLAAAIDSEIEVSATGPDAAAAMEALADLVARRFDEDE